MMGHQQPERAERESEEKLVAGEVCQKEVSGRKDPTSKASSQPGKAHASGNNFHAIGLVIDGNHFSFSSFSRSAGASSDALTFWLSCRARMYAAMAQRSSGWTSVAYECITPYPLVITSKKCPIGASRRRDTW